MLYWVILEAICSRDSVCSSAHHELADFATGIGIPESDRKFHEEQVRFEQAKFMGPRIFCVTCGAPNRFTTNFVPKTLPKSATQV